MRQTMPLEVGDRGLSLTCDSHKVSQVRDMHNVLCSMHYSNSMHPHHIFRSVHLKHPFKDNVFFLKTDNIAKH